MVSVTIPRAAFIRLTWIAVCVDPYVIDTSIPQDVLSMAFEFGTKLISEITPSVLNPPISKRPEVFVTKGDMNTPVIFLWVIPFLNRLSITVGTIPVPLGFKVPLVERGRPTPMTPSTPKKYKKKLIGAPIHTRKKIS